MVESREYPGAAGQVLLVGLNHRTAPIAVRDRVAIGQHELADALERLRAAATDVGEALEEAAIVSTCNRTELYAAGAGERLPDILVRFLCARSGIAESDLRKHLYTLRGGAAATHLFRVAAGLDSMILGESQVLGQTREAYAVARECGAAGRLIGGLFEAALRAAKRARTETGIARGAVSVSFAAVELARQIFGRLEDKEVLIVGAGEMGALTMDNLREQGARACFVANRSLARAEEMARAHGARVYPWDQLDAALNHVDIVIASTSAPHSVLSADAVREAMKRRRNRPLFLVDIAVPRDVEPAAGEIYNVFLFNIDDLKAVIEENIARRAQEVARAEEIVAAEVARFLAWAQALEADDTIAQLRRWAEQQRVAEFDRLKNKLGGLSAEQLAAIEQFSQRLTNKFLDRPSRGIKSAYRIAAQSGAAAPAEGAEPVAAGAAPVAGHHPVLHALRHLFGIGETAAATPAPSTSSTLPVPTPTAMELDDTDCRICDAIQTDFPLDPEPFAIIARSLNLEAGDVLRRVRAMKSAGVIRQISAIFDSRRLGYSSLLAAFAVPADRLDAVAATVSAHRGVSHSYERRHQFNLWFTLTVPPGEDSETQAAELAERTQTALWIALPALRTFKIGVSFQLSDNGGESPPTPRRHHPQTAETARQYPRPSDDDIALIRALQRDIPLKARPFRLQAERLGLTETELLDKARELQARKLMRRFAAVLRHREAGFAANGMACWTVSPERLADIGPRVAAFAEVSHCYERRPAPPAWPYNLFAMIHGRERAEVESTTRRIREEVGLPEPEILYSDREFKKERVVYFP